MSYMSSSAIDMINRKAKVGDRVICVPTLFPDKHLWANEYWGKSGTITKIENCGNSSCLKCLVKGKMQVSFDDGTHSTLRCFGWSDQEENYYAFEMLDETENQMFISFAVEDMMLYK